MVFEEAKKSRLGAEGDCEFFPSKSDAQCHRNASILPNDGMRASARVLHPRPSRSMEMAFV